MDNKTSAKNRGAADSYYMRAKSPHYILDGKAVRNLTAAETAAYHEGFLENENDGNFKNYR